MNGKCPHCDKFVSAFSLKDLDANHPNDRGYKAVALACPSCNAILAAQIDPVAIRTETVDQVVAELRKHGVIQ